MAKSPEALLKQLLARGDAVKVEAGRLVIDPMSGDSVPPEWLQEHERPLIAEAARLAGVEALEYLSYSVGNYGPSKGGGVVLQFRSLVDSGVRYAIFNVSTKRARSTKHGKAGSPLSPGRFRVGKRSHFLKFWRATGLKEPKSLDAFSDYMGHLRAVAFTGTQTAGERLDAGTLRPIWLTHRELTNQHPAAPNMPGNSRVSSGLNPGKVRVRNPGKEIPQSQQPQGLQPNQTTGEKNHGNTVIREYGYTGSPLSPHSREDISAQKAGLQSKKPPQEQTVDEWLSDYGPL